MNPGTSFEREVVCVYACMCVTGICARSSMATLCAFQRYVLMYEKYLRIYDSGGLGFNASMQRRSTMN